MITHNQTGEPVAGVRYYLIFDGNDLGPAVSMYAAMDAVEKNPGMHVEAQTWRIVDPDYGVEELGERYRCYPPSS